MSTVGDGGDSLLVFHIPREGAARTPPYRLCWTWTSQIGVVGGWEVGVGRRRRRISSGRCRMMNRNALVSLHFEEEEEENEQLLITCEINEFQFERTDTDGRTDQEK